MITLLDKDRVSINITLGDRNADGKVDITVEAAVRVPSMMGITSPHVQQIGPFTENVPLEQAKAVASMVANGGIPAAGGVIGWVFHAAVGAMKLSG